MAKILSLPVTNGSTVFVNPLQVSFFKAAQSDSEVHLVGRSEPLWIRLSPEALVTQLNDALKN